MKEERIKKILKSKGYKQRAKITWTKLSKKNGVPVNGSGVVSRHSNETCYVFSKGKVTEMSRYH